jgi:UDP-galactopyranose mutase
MREKYIEEIGRLKAGSFLFIGRLAEYKYYNMDKAIESAPVNTRKWIESNQ